MSGTVDPKSLKGSMRNYKAIGCGLFLQFIVLPFIGFLCVRIFLLTPPLGLTLLVVTSSPGGSYSNWWCSIFNASLSLSVTMTAISTILSTVFLPLNLLIYANLAYSSNIVSELKWGAMFLSLGVVCTAIGLGLWGSAWSRRKRKGFRFQYICNKLGNISGICLVIFSFVISSLDPQGAIWNRDFLFYMAVASPCILGVVISTFLSSSLSLSPPERVTVSVECCYQNVGIAQSIAISMFTGSELADAIGVPLYYGIVEAVVLGVFCIICWKVGWTNAPSHESFCVVVSTNYETEIQEMLDEGQEVIYGMEHELALGLEESGSDESEGSKKKAKSSSWLMSPTNAFRRWSSRAAANQDGHAALRKTASKEESPSKTGTVASFSPVPLDDSLCTDTDSSAVTSPPLTTSTLFTHTYGLVVSPTTGDLKQAPMSSPTSTLLKLGGTERAVAICINDLIEGVEVRDGIRQRLKYVGVSVNVSMALSGSASVSGEE